ncbi:hypothetical protein DICVIV_10305 [Dictyocaulus viviparus]|uniref:Uncharacterized protein n=1 Tax=Dictyocaulus viviparus TaxID=29172 RepID=A0A0D8XMV5_DICVI|nr:hypothetical protein DICVIV_10305 [Dictyocaulus viviparus]
MGFQSPARGRGSGTRGGHQTGKRDKSGEFKSHGRSIGGLNESGGETVTRDISTSSEKTKGGDKGRGFAVGKRGDFTPNSQRGRGNFNTRGARGGSSFRGDRGGSNLHSGRGSFTPRGSHGSSGFRGSIRGARGSFSEKSKTKSRSDSGPHISKVASSTNTPIHTKKAQSASNGKGLEKEGDSRKSVDEYSKVEMEDEEEDDGTFSYFILAIDIYVLF